MSFLCAKVIFFKILLAIRSILLYNNCTPKIFCRQEHIIAIFWENLAIGG